MREKLMALIIISAISAKTVVLGEKWNPGFQNSGFTQRLKGIQILKTQHSVIISYLFKLKN